MSHPQPHHHDLVYALDARPPLPQTLFAALQHMLAMFVEIGRAHV